MVTLLESKLNSLPPEITSKYPELGHAVILEVKPDVNINQQNYNNTQQVQQTTTLNKTETKLQAEEAPVIEEKKEIEEVKLDPVSIFNEFIEENPEYETYYKMVKFKIPIMAVEQKAQREGVDMDMVKVSIHLI